MNADTNNDPKKRARDRLDADIESDVHTIKQAGIRLSTSARSIWRLISKGELRTVRIGRSVRVTRASVTCATPSRRNVRR